MPRRNTRFGSPYNFGLVASMDREARRVEIFTPSLGLHRGVAAQNLAPGYTPDAANFVIDAGHLTPRSGLSRFRSTTSLGAPALGAFRVLDLQSEEYIIASSQSTFSLFDPADDAWSTLSYESALTDAPSGLSRNYWDCAVSYEPSIDANIAVLCNGINVPKVLNIGSSTVTFSDVTDFVSLASTADALCAFDNRLVYFNLASAASTFPQRVLWSARGAPLNYQLASGAGFEDLVDMRGQGRRVIAERDSILLFSDEEIWRGRKRLDAYAFDFYPIERQLGAPFARAIARTPLGVIFLSRDLELYLISGDQIAPLGPAREGEASRVQAHLRETLYEPARAWACYNPTQRRFELHYTGADSDEGFPTRAIYYHIVERAFTYHTFEHELSAGVEYKDPGGAGPTWDSSAVAWDDAADSWDGVSVPGSDYYTHAFSSVGTPYRFYSSQTNDDGSSYTAYWKSHAMNREDAMRFDRFTELWIEYSNELDSNVSVMFSSDVGHTFSDAINVSLPQKTYGRALAPAFVVGASPQFKVTVGNGSRPRLARFQAQLSEAGLYGGEA